MKDFPHHVLLMAFPCIIPAVLSVFFLFAVHPFGTPEYAFLRFLLYITTQLLWIFPIACFFAGLDRYRRGFRRTAYAILTLGLLFTISDILLLVLKV